MTTTNHLGTSTELHQPYRRARHATKHEHICPTCIRPGDLIDLLDITLYVDKGEPYTHPAIVPAGEIWAVTSDRPPRESRGITLSQATFCPFEPVPGSVLPCGCHIQRGCLHDAVLCPEHSALMNTRTADK